MSEKNPQLASSVEDNKDNVLPSRDEFIASIQDRRDELNKQLDELESTPGFKFSNGQYEKDRKLKDLYGQLDVVESEWSRLGGEKVDGAQKSLDDSALHVERFYREQDLEAAKDEFYANFVAEKTMNGDDESSVEGSTDDNKNDDIENVRTLNQEALDVVSLFHEKMKDPSVDPEDKRRILEAIRQIKVNIDQPLNPEDEDDQVAPEDESEEQSKAPAALTELPDALKAKLEAARDKFAAAKIDVETHFFKKWFGGLRRQEYLERAAKDLKRLELEAAKIRLAPEIERLKGEVEAGNLEAEKQQELTAQLIAATVFAKSQEVEKLASKKYDEMLEGRSGFKKFMAKTGNWFTKGGKVSQWLRLGGFGAFSGAATSMILGPAGWPITAAAGLPTALAVASTVKQGYLESRKGETRGHSSYDAWATNTLDEDYDITKDSDELLKTVVEKSVDQSMEDSENKRDELRKKLRGAFGKYALGFGMGSFITGAIQSVAGAESAGGGVDTNGGTEAGPESSVETGTEGGGGVEQTVDTAGTEITPEVTPDFSQYDYPWSWAAEQFGEGNAREMLHELADKAAANGHSVEWANAADGNPFNDQLWINGTDDSARIIEILNQYK